MPRDGRSRRQKGGHLGGERLCSEPGEDAARFLQWCVRLVDSARPPKTSAFAEQSISSLQDMSELTPPRRGVRISGKRARQVAFGLGKSRAGGEHAINMPWRDDVKSCEEPMSELELPGGGA
jgi:hypothetical protein